MDDDDEEENTGEKKDNAAVEADTGGSTEVGKEDRLIAPMAPPLEDDRLAAGSGAAEDAVVTQADLNRINNRLRKLTTKVKVLREDVEELYDKDSELEKATVTTYAYVQNVLKANEVENAVKSLEQQLGDGGDDDDDDDDHFTMDDDDAEEHSENTGEKKNDAAVEADTGGSAEVGNGDGIDSDVSFENNAENAPVSSEAENDYVSRAEFNKLVKQVKKKDADIETLQDAIGELDDENYALAKTIKATREDFELKESVNTLQKRIESEPEPARSAGQESHGKNKKEAGVKEQGLCRCS